MMEQISAQKANMISILDIFSKDDVTETTTEYKTTCPDCGLQGGRTEGFILFPNTNSSYCHSSNKHFTFLETYALKKKIISCLDGRDTGDNARKVLGGELFTYTLEEFKNEYGTEKYNQLLNQLNIRKRIKLSGNNKLISDFANELGDIYKSRNVLFFRGESREIVEVGRYKKINHEGKEYVETGFIPINGNRFITFAEMLVIPYYETLNKDDEAVEITRSIPLTLANTVLESPNFQDKLPVITRIFNIQIPIIYKGQLTFPKKGYDKRFGSWLPFNAPEIKQGMKLEEAKSIIDSIFEEFCFASEKDKTNAIAGFITPFLRGLYPTFSTRTPIFIYMANRERAGKDYCAGCTGMLYEGMNIEQPAISTDENGFSHNNDELKKKIIACLLQGKKRFHSSNNKGFLNNSILEGITTAEIWEDRILGKSHSITFNNELDFSLSGNLGITLTPDLANRARIVNLHLIDEDANARKFRNPNLHEWILKNRNMIISAIYKLVDNWIEKGKPKGSIPFTSFPFWADICGGIMECSGYDNPCKKEYDIIVSLDSETEEMKQLFESCYQNHPNEWINKDDIIKVIQDENIMNFDLNNKSELTRLGLRLVKYSNRILSGILMNVDSNEKRFYRKGFIFKKIGQNIEKNSQNEEKCAPCAHFAPFNTPSTVEKKIINKLEECVNVHTCAQGAHNTEYLTLTQLSQKYNSQNVVPKIKIKTDRELQFWEAPECENIKAQCTKEQVFDWIKANPDNGLEKMDEALGLGCLKFAIQLINENKVKRNEKGWFNTC